MRYMVNREGYSDTPKKTPLQTNIDNLITYAQTLVTLGLIVDPTTPGGKAIKSAIANMSSGKIDISNSNSKTILLQARSDLFDPMYAKSVFNKLAPAILLNQYNLDKMSVADIRTFLYKMKDAMGESNDAIKAYSAIEAYLAKQKSIYKSDDPTQQVLEAATAVYCVIPSIISATTKQTLGTPVCNVT